MKEITQSIFKKENKGKKMTISIFFFKNRIIIMINPFRKRSERGFVFIRQGIFKNSAVCTINPTQKNLKFINIFLEGYNNLCNCYFKE